MEKAAEAANDAHLRLKKLGVAGRAKVIEIVKHLAVSNAKEWGKFEMELPFQVDLNFCVNRLASLVGCKCLYVEMQAMEANLWNADTVAAGMTNLDDLVK